MDYKTMFQLKTLMPYERPTLSIGVDHLYVD